MYKLFLLTVVIGGFIFAGSWDNSSKSDGSLSDYKRYALVQDTSSDDDKIEAGRRRGKGNKGRRRGGGGLR